jgi:hypothetical protein
MKNYIFGSALAMLIAGCAQPGLRPDQVSQPTVKNFPACELSVRFSGQPQETKWDLGKEMIEEVGDKTEVQMWFYLSEIRGITKREVAFCGCPPDPLKSNPRFRILRPGPYSKTIKGVGDIQDTPVVETDQGMKMVMRETWGSSPMCYLTQVFFSKGSNEAVRDIAEPFISSTASIVQEPKGATTNTNALPAPERLRQLEALRNEKLISEDEFKARRALIIDGL